MKWRVKLARWLAPHAFYALEGEARELRAVRHDLIIKNHALGQELDLTRRVRDNFERAAAEGARQLEGLYARAWGRLSPDDQTWARIHLGLPISLGHLHGSELARPEPRDVYAALPAVFGRRGTESDQQCYTRGAWQLYQYVYGADAYRDSDDEAIIEAPIITWPKE